MVLNRLNKSTPAKQTQKGKPNFFRAKFVNNFSPKKSDFDTAQNLFRLRKSRIKRLTVKPKIDYLGLSENERLSKHVKYIKHLISSGEYWRFKYDLESYLKAHPDSAYNIVEQVTRSMYSDIIKYFKYNQKLAIVHTTSDLLRFSSCLNKYNFSFAKGLGKSAGDFASYVKLCPESFIRGLGNYAGWFAFGLGKNAYLFAQGFGAQKIGFIAELKKQNKYESFINGLLESQRQYFR